MRRVTLSDRLRYQFDNLMSRGPVALIGGLFLASLVIIVVISLLVYLAGIAPEQEGGERPGFLALVWMSLMRTLDAGTMGGDTGSWPFLLAMFAVTLGGVFVVSTLIGVLSSGIEGKLEDLRKGRSLVIERDHTIILGWSEQVIPIIAELVVANANENKPCIAILAEKDKVEMEDEIREKVGATGRTRLVCRTGSPLDLNDLDIVNPYGARTIIIPSPDVGQPDASVIKCIAALTNNPRRRPQPYHIVAEIRNRKNMDVARMVGRNEVVLVQASELIPRMTAQTCRQSGLSVVYTELLDFGGDEIYIHEEPGLVGKTFAEVIFAYEDSTIIGLVAQDGRTRVKPPMNTPITRGDKVIAISADDDTVRLSGLTDYHVDQDALVRPRKRVARPERTLILGWNGRGPIIIGELDSYVAPGSEVKVVAAADSMEGWGTSSCPELHNTTCSVQPGDTTDRVILDGLDIPSYHHVIVLSYSDTMDAQQADNRTLLTLLHLRDIADKSGHPFSITSEIMDIRNRQLAEVTRADDFVVSNKLVSLMMSQVAENPQLDAVFADLFDPQGAEIYLKPAEDYVVLGKPVNFYTVLEAARRQDQVAIGYRLHAQANDASQSYGVCLNPDKSRMVAFAAEDRMIVLAEG